MGGAGPDEALAFIARWRETTGGAERANYALFLTELCDVIGVARPDPATHESENNAYAFERAVTFRDGGERVGHGRIDLYKRGSFVLEAKQSRWKGGAKAIPGQSDLFTAETDTATRNRADRRWDVLMMNARRQAEEYAKALPSSDGWPPFVIVCDVGHCLEIFADFTGQGKDYRQFPDRQSFRIFLDDLADASARDLLRRIWDEPLSLDPAKKAARATREIAAHLAEVSRRLEKKGENAEEVATFLMRCLFTMFAEDVELLQKGSFTRLLERCIDAPEKFARMVEQLWQAMDTGDFAYAIEADVRQFNGTLFHGARAFQLDREDIGVLLAASKADWREVDPSIFGTLLEQALDPAERSRLGAHYTPRAYVERLVIATIMEPLRNDWAQVLSTAERQKLEGDGDGAVRTVRRFHERLCDTRVLDPACGTGNFLYVSLELMKRLEGEVVEALADLGGQEALRGLDRHEIDPHQFLGLELNGRARHIAELVLWIGFLQWHLRNRGELPGDPVLKNYRNIRAGDAVLTWDGYPAPTVANGEETLPGARRPDWPEAEFIVGNPPFIGGKDIRARLGDLYAETLWRVHREMNDSADFVMYWWDRAADILTCKGAKLRRFGFVTTNSIAQVFQRRVVERRLSGSAPVSLVMAIPDHPWTKATKDSAAVRIAMTVAEAGAHEGVLRKVVREAGLDSDQPVVELSESTGKINADLTVGVDVGSTAPLLANAGLGYRGMQLMGSGFIITPSQAEHLGVSRRPDLKNHIRRYRNGRDLMERPRGVMVIDLFGLTQEQVRERYPEAYQYLLQAVKPERDRNNRDSYKRNWWIFGEPRRELRPALAGLPRYIATVETAKHRIFQFLDPEILPDNMLVAIASDDAFHLGALSSRAHVTWALNRGGTLEDRPRYTKSHCFDPFPFPDPDAATRTEIAWTAEAIDRHRKERQQAHPGLTLTQMYNVLERVRAISAAERELSARAIREDGSPSSARPSALSSNSPASGRISHSLSLSDEEIRIFEQGLILILKELHERLDAAVLRAYGWPPDASDEEILARLAALNAERAAEERRGQVRWLRPDYQIARFGSASDREQFEAELTGGAGAEMTGEKRTTAKPALPADPVAQTGAIMPALAASSAPLSAGEIAAGFRQGGRVERKIALTLTALARLGHLSSSDGGRSFRLRRAA